MTPEAKHALELLAVSRKSYNDYERVRAEYTINKHESDDSVMNRIAYKHREEAFNERFEKGWALGDYCAEHASMKKEFQDEIKKLDAKIKEKYARFDKENKGTYDHISERRSKLRNKSSRYSALKNLVTALLWIIGIGWAVSYVVLLFTLPPESTLRQLLNSGMTLLLFIPEIAWIFLSIFIKNLMSNFALSPATQINALDSWYKELQVKKEKTCSDLLSLKRDYEEIIHIIDFRTK